MTNTLHRSGKAETFRDDYIIFAMPSKGKNDQGAIEKLRRFLEICVGTPCAESDQGPGLVTQYTFLPVPGACCIPASGTCEVLTLTDCVATDGTWMGPETNCDDADFNGNPDICENTCQGDVDGDGEVGIVDFLIVIGNWGTCQ